MKANSRAPFPRISVPPPHYTESLCMVPLGERRKEQAELGVGPPLHHWPLSHKDITRKQISGGLPSRKVNLVGDNFILRVISFSSGRKKKRTSVF